MEFADAILVRLAEPGTRAAIFDELALRGCVSAAYTTDGIALDGPFAAVFDELRLGVAAPARGRLEGGWNEVGGTVRTEARFELTPPGGGDVRRVDALWRGAVTARASTGGAPIASVKDVFAEPHLLDSDIRTAHGGSLPASAATLEQERRTRVMDRIKAGLDDPALLTDAAFDAFLSHSGAASVGDLMIRSTTTTAFRALQVTLGPEGPVAQQPRRFALVAAVLVRDAGFSLAALLADSHALMDDLGAAGVAGPTDARLPQRRSLVVVWVIPSSTFDDDDWPGGTAGDASARRLARRRAAGRWLADEGIAVAAVT